MVIMEDPEGKWINVGTYRVCVHDKNTLGIWISPGKHGRSIKEEYRAQGQTLSGSSSVSAKTRSSPKSPAGMNRGEFQN